MNKTNPKVDWYFAKATKWQKELAQLRIIVLSAALSEELKWGVPCYTFEGSNVLLLHVFKEYCALLFVKGALLKDEKNILIQQTEHVQSARQTRFTDVREITKMKSILKAYIAEAIEVEKSGVKVKFKKTAAFKMPEEFKKKMEHMPALKTAFAALTPGRQRGYLLYFSQAKLSKTREARIEKSIPLIFDGLGVGE